MADKLKIAINAETMTWDDMRLLLTLQDRGADATPADMLKLVELFDRFVEGGAKAVPVARTADAIAAIVKAIGDLTNPKNLSSGSTPISGQVPKKRRRSTSS